MNTHCHDSAVTPTSDLRLQSSALGHRSSDLRPPSSDRRSFFRWLAAGPLSIAAVTVSRALPPDPENETGPNQRVDCGFQSDVPVLPAIPDIEEYLKRWMSCPRIPVLDSENGTVRHLIRALLLNKPVEFKYQGGGTYGETRRAHPVMLFRVENFDAVYLTAFCETRKEIRTFRVDRMVLQVESEV